ncbi:MAG TPA: glycine zipper 2TM domain-containing protein [Gammaproteobacteria bacterium]|nr:glycine zipper 2TM domain-containing protein [Gammaproteobacteria bacterium]
MNKVTLIAGVMVMALAYMQSARADRYPYPSHGNGTYTDMAEVIEVEPITRLVRVETPRRECWDEEVPVRRSARYHGSATPTIIGGIIGGVVGNQFGKGDGKTAMTVAGALLGGSIGRDHARRHAAPHDYTEYTTTQTRCTVRTEYHEEERVEAYRVKYSYNGRVYVTRMKEPPGDGLPVSVSVVPIR